MNQLFNFLSLLLVVAFTVITAKAQKFSNLLEYNWEFKNVTENEWMPANHFDVHLDLLENSKIDAPYYGNNELAQRWIERENWEYRTTIDFEDSALGEDHIELVFEGLDTYATVYLNDTKVLTATNMFRTWKVDVKPHLKRGKNTLRVVFESPLNVNKNKVNNAAYELPAANETVNLKVSPYTRKAAYQFGWDWGPRFVTMGFWKKCYFKGWSGIKTAHPFVYLVGKNDSVAQLKLTFEALVDSSQKATYSFQFGDDDIFPFASPKHGVNEIDYLFEIKNPILWHPSGYGEQFFYEKELNTLKNGRIIRTETIRFAIRTVELINQTDEIGTSYFFKVNGQPIYAKGANYIPQDLFLNRVKPNNYKRLIQQAADAGFNMIRVWGGGIYERDYFYDLCDEYGILVWQDFMFANSMYPTDAEFKENVRLEIIDNVKRLRNHPCVALWCGNNEIEVAWENWGWQKQYGYSKAQETEIWDNYTALFHEMIPKTLSKYDPTRAYVPTTPLSNWGES